MPEMLEYLQRIGYSVSSGFSFGCIYVAVICDSQVNDLNKLNAVHITGTKGKGSISAFTGSILRRVKPEWKAGGKHEHLRTFTSLIHRIASISHNVPCWADILHPCSYDGLDEHLIPIKKVLNKYTYISVTAEESVGCRD